MTMFLAPYTAIADIDGSPLDAGFLFFGEYGKDPESFPVEVYFDPDFTIPAAQPIRTRNGYPVRNGSPTKIYLKATQYSIAIKNRKGAFVLVDFKNKGWTDSVVATWSGRTQEEKNRDFVSLNDYKNGANDYQQALQTAINENEGRCIYITAGVYELASVNIPHDVSLDCEHGVVFKRKALTDISQLSPWQTGVAMFEINKQGVYLSFLGSPVFDGNNQEQIARMQEPSGWAIKIQPPAEPVQSDTETKLYIQNPTFIHGTRGYIAVRGDDYRRRYLTKVILDNPTFRDTLQGIGANDPNALSALGWQPDYCLIHDYVHFISKNTTMTFSKTNGVGEYSPVGIRGTYSGSNSDWSGECSVFLYGHTYLKNMGRSSRVYNSMTEFGGNNAIGAIDMYGNAESLYIEDIEADNSEFVTVRAKGSLKNYTIGSAVLRDCHRGLQVGPSSTGACETVVNVGSFTSYNGVIPQLEFTGTSVDDRLLSVTMNSCYLYGNYTNTEGLSSTGTANIIIKNTIRFSAYSPRVLQSPVVGILLSNITVAELYSPVARSVFESLKMSGVSRCNCYSFDLTSETRSAVTIQDSSSVQVESATFFGGRTLGSVDNAVLILSLNEAAIVFDALSISNVTGASRGFSSSAESLAKITITNCSANSVSMPISKGSIVYREFNNSWNPNVQFGTLYQTTIGKHKRGDIVYNISPSAGGSSGWICVSGDGSSVGTWKEFGAIQA